ncbi:MAG: Rieske 2Fe-2S domain-containing protein [Planctomycetota bacterium]|jgi:nitrite reductase (NADH) small subunit
MTTDHDDDDLRWKDVGTSADWAELNSCRTVAIGARRLAVFRTEQGWFAIKDRCPHNGLPLADGPVHDGCVSCPYHGWTFDLASGCGPNDSRVATYPVRINGKRVEIGV